MAGSYRRKLSEEISAQYCWFKIDLSLNLHFTSPTIGDMLYLH